MGRRTMPIEDVPKIELAFEDQPLLQDLGFDDLIKEYKHVKTKEIEYSIKVFDTKNSIKSQVEAVNADTVAYKDWKSTIVRSLPSKKLNMNLLIRNLMIIAKLDAGMLQKVMEASQEPVEPKAPYLRIFAPKGALPKKPTGDDE